MIQPSVVMARENVEIQQQTHKISGTVKDDKGNPIIGATVKEKGSAKGAITNLNGEFSIDVKEGASLEVSYIGFDKQTFTAVPGQALNVVMKENTKNLDELVVVGYGVQKKSNLTGSVASVNAETLASRPISSISAAIAGEMPGVTAVQSSGAPGSQSASITRAWKKLH